MMRRFAANYLLTDTGILLKNGIAHVAEDGTVGFTDTRGDLRESERLIFYNGILLLQGYDFVKDTSKKLFSTQRLIQYPALYSALKSDHLSMAEIVDLARQLQDQYPDIRIPDLLDKIAQILVLDANYTKEPVPGIYLLTGADLLKLHFTPKSRLKKII